MDLSIDLGFFMRCPVPQASSEHSAQLFKLDPSINIQEYSFSWTQKPVSFNELEFEQLCAFTAAATSGLTRDSMSCEDIQHGGRYCFLLALLKRRSEDTDGRFNLDWKRMTAASHQLQEDVKR